MSQDMTICGLEIKRGTKLRAMLPVPDTMTKIPLTVINGVEDGPTLLITAGIHGGEYPGIAAAIELGCTRSISRASGRAANSSYPKTAKT